MLRKNRLCSLEKEAVSDKINGEIRKEIYVPGRIINLVVK